MLERKPKSSPEARARATAWNRANRERRREIVRRSYLKSVGGALKPVLSPQQRFEASIERVPESGCWLWTRSVNRNGYGKVKVSGRHLTAHRWSWMLHRGEITNGLHVLHRCDVTACVNPNHLWLGTGLDNVRDMWSKGRRGELRGGSMPNEENPHAKFSDQQIAEMRAEKAKGIETSSAIAKRMGVSLSHFFHVVSGKVRKVSHV